MFQYHPNGDIWPLLAQPFEWAYCQRHHKSLVPRGPSETIFCCIHWVALPRYPPLIFWYSVSLLFTLLKAAFLVDCSIEALLLAPSYPPTTFQLAVVELSSQFVQFFWTWAPHERKKPHIPIGSDWPIGCMHSTFSNDHCWLHLLSLMVNPKLT